MKKVAITGGLSSGKTSVCQIFKELGAYTISADELVHRLLTPSSPLGKQVVSLFGEDTVSGDTILRAKIAEKAFFEKEKLKALEKLLHPAVLEEIEKTFNQIKQNKEFNLFVAEIPLLYEIEVQDRFDHVIVVTADQDVCRKRYGEKTQQSPADFENRMMHQLPISQKLAAADFAIENNGSKDQLIAQVRTLHQTLTNP